MALNIDSVTELYNNYKPAYNNLYEVLIFDSKISDTLDVTDYIKFHALKIGFNGESIGLTRNDVTKQFQLNDAKAFTRSDTLTIDWNENEDWLVKKYHEAWLNMFYNKDEDYYYSHDKDSLSKIYRTIKVILPRSTSFSGTCDCITFYKVLPQNAPGLSLSWSPSASIVGHSLTYYVTSWKWDTYTEASGQDVTDSSSSGDTSSVSYVIT